MHGCKHPNHQRNLRPQGRQEGGQEENPARGYTIGSTRQRGVAQPCCRRRRLPTLPHSFRRQVLQPPRNFGSSSHRSATSDHQHSRTLRCRTRQHAQNQRAEGAGGGAGEVQEAGAGEGQEEGCLECHIARQSTRRHRYSAACRGRNLRDRNRGCSRSSSGPGTSTSSLHRTCCSNRLGHRRRRGIARLGHGHRDQTRRRKRKPVSQTARNVCERCLVPRAVILQRKHHQPGHADRGCCSKDCAAPAPAHCRSRLRRPRARPAPATLPSSPLFVTRVTLAPRATQQACSYLHRRATTAVH